MTARIRPRTALLAAASVLAGWLVQAVPAQGSPSTPSSTTTAAADRPVHLAEACPATGPGTAHCLALVRTDANGQPLDLPGPQGLTPADLQSAYRLPSTSAGAGHTVAIVDAFDSPHVESDLATYRARFRLPPCTTANGCFRKVDQRGGTDYPAPDAGWAVEVSLDVDMVSAVCPKCRILLVEADDNANTNMALSVATAARLGATEISNSYGAFEFPGQVQLEQYYHQSGIPVVASSGDFGYGVQFPSSSQYVTAVGGTTLVRAHNARGWSERAWEGSGSGCSAYTPKPAWQHDRLCPRRSVADVAAVADPVTGLAVYDTFGQPGWISVGGTSAAAPIVAGVYALAGQHQARRGRSGDEPARRPYTRQSQLFDVTTWANGTCGDYLCTAGHGYDGPTGLGTPNGTGAF